MTDAKKISALATPSPSPELNAHELQRAFTVFNQVSQELTLAYEGLQARVASLTEELAIANGQLRLQYQEKEALSERLSSLLNALPAGVIVLNSHARISEANPAATHMFGHDLLDLEWCVLAQQHLLPTEAPDEWQLAQQLRRVAIAETPLDSAGGRLLLIHDITVAHGLQEGLERNKRLAAMGEMAASLAHQLRTPLATALLYSANLAQADLPDASRTRFAEKASAQLQRLERLIQDVLFFARGESIGRDRIPVSALLAEIMHTMRPLFHEKNIHFCLNADVGQHLIIGSRKALSGALCNLLDNALQSCLTTLETHPERRSQVTLSANVCDRELSIQISDTGSGINEAVRAKIFEPFFTTRGQGTGLGLAIALGVARAHGGALHLRASSPAGSEFILSLPVSLPVSETSLIKDPA